jgi:hypothetical protein
VNRREPAKVQVLSFLSFIAPIQTKPLVPFGPRPASCGKMQQPKQSQPFGVKGLQTCAHIADWVAGQSLSPTMLGVYEQSAPSGLSGSQR